MKVIHEVNIDPKYEDCHEVWDLFWDGESDRTMSDDPDTETVDVLPILRAWFAERMEWEWEYAH